MYIKENQYSNCVKLLYKYHYTTPYCENYALISYNIYIKLYMVLNIGIYQNKYLKLN